MVDAIAYSPNATPEPITPIAVLHKPGIRCSCLVTGDRTLLQSINMADSTDNTKGFTLTELLVAMAITSIVVTLAGGGLVAIMKANAKAEDETLRRVELNRALDFIADEVRGSQSIASNASTATYNIASGATNAQPILALTVPGVTNPIVYYIADPPSSSVWSGPKVIYRWGPTLGANGTYSSPGTNYNEVLIDFIDNSTAPNSSCASPSTNPNPAVANRKGFYSCIDSQGTITNIYLRGKLTNSSTPYEVSTTVFARS